MSIEFHCGGCDRRFEVPDHLAGKQAKCTTCGQIFEVPYSAGAGGQSEPPQQGQFFDLNLDDLQAAVAAEQHSTALTRPALRKQNDSNVFTIVLITVGGVGSALLVLVMVTVAMMLAGSLRKTASSSDTTHQAARRDAGPSVRSPSPPSSDASPPETDFADARSTDTPPAASTPDRSEDPFDRESAKPEPAASSPTPSPSETSPAPESSNAYAVWGSVEPDFKVTIPNPGFFGTFAFSPPPQPYLAAGPNVFDLETGKQVGRISEKLEGVERCALSPDGKLFAKAEKKLGGKVDLVLCETGRLWRELIVPSFAGKGPLEEALDSMPPALREKVASAPGNPFEDAPDNPSAGPAANKEIAVEWLEFIDDETLLSVVSSNFKGAAFLWDVAGGEVKSQFAMEAANAQRCALSRDGKYLASSQGDTFVVRELPKGKVVAVMQTPPRAGEAGFPMLGCQGAAFSPDGTELAACLRWGNMLRVVCWNAQAKLIFDQPRIRLASSGGAGVGAIQWVPDGSGWLLDGRYLLDRQSKRLVWQLEQMYDRLGCRFRTKESLLVNRSGRGELELVRMEFPWTEIHEALARIDSDEGVLLRPGGAATLQVQLGTLRYSNPQQTAQELTQVLTERLSIDDIGLAPDRPMRLVAFYTEKAGETLKVVEQYGPFSFDVRDTGRTVEETKGLLELKWVDEGGRVVWEREITRTTARHGELEKISSANLQKDMFKGVLNVLAGVRVPYFIPSDPGAAMLPVVSKVTP